jgi:hypothetical protein
VQPHQHVSGRGRSDQRVGERHHLIGDRAILAAEQIAYAVGQDAAGAPAGSVGARLTARAAQELKLRPSSARALSYDAVDGAPSAQGFAVHGPVDQHPDLVTSRAAGRMVDRVAVAARADRPQTVHCWTGVLQQVAHRSGWSPRPRRVIGRRRPHPPQLIARTSLRRLHQPRLE